MAYVPTKSGVLVPAHLKPDKGVVAPEEPFAGRSFHESSSPADGMTPANLIQILRNAGTSIVDQAKLFDAMEERDPDIGAHMGTRRSAVLAEGKQTLPDPKAKDQKLAQRAADLCIEAAERLDAQAEEGGNDDGVRVRGGFNDMLIYALDAVGKAFSVAEPVWDTSEKQWWWDHWEERPQRWFQFAGDEIRLRNNTAEGQRMNPLNIWRHIHRAKPGTVQTAALFRQLARPYVLKNYALKDFLSFSEVFGMPVRVGYYAEGMLDEQKEEIWRMLKKIGTDACALLPEGARVDFPEVHSASGVQTVWEKMMEMAGRWECMLILGQLSTIEQGGSYAKAVALQSVRYDIRDDDAQRLENFVRYQMFRPLVKLNLGADAPVPILQITRTPPKDTKAMIEGFKEGANMGMRIGVAFAHEELGWPVADDDDDVLQPSATNPFENLTSAASMLAATAGGLKKKRHELSTEQLARYVR